jgi:hypothetical protein
VSGQFGAISGNPRFTLGGKRLSVMIVTSFRIDVGYRQLPTSNKGGKGMFRHIAIALALALCSLSGYLMALSLMG